MTFAEAWPGVAELLRMSEADAGLRYGSDTPVAVTCPQCGERTERTLKRLNSALSACVRRGNTRLLWRCDGCRIGSAPDRTAHDALAGDERMARLYDWDAERAKRAGVGSHRDVGVTCAACGRAVAGDVRSILSGNRVCGCEASERMRGRTGHRFERAVARQLIEPLAELGIIVAYDVSVRFDGHRGEWDLPLVSALDDRGRLVDAVTAADVVAVVDADGHWNHVSNRSNDARKTQAALDGGVSPIRVCSPYVPPLTGSEHGVAGLLEAVAVREPQERYAPCYVEAVVELVRAAIVDAVGVVRPLDATLVERIVERSWGASTLLDRFRQAAA